MLLSIILPVYNVEKYIERCLTSLCHQDISSDDYEIIAVNDCSPDNSKVVLQYLQRTTPNLVLLDHSINKGVGAARNTGLKHATGDYIWFVDTDDYIESNCLKKITNELTHYDLDILSFNFFRQDHTLQFHADKVNFTTTSAVLSGDIFLKSHYQPTTISPCSKIYRRKYLITNKFKFTEGVFWEDADWVMQVLYYAEKIKYVPDHYYYYCYNDQSTSRTLSGKKIADMVKMGYRKLAFSKEIAQHSMTLSEKIRSDALWNATAVKNIIYLTNEQRQLFYTELSDKIYEEIKHSVPNRYYRFLFINSKIAGLILQFVSPVLRYLKTIKHHF